MFKHFLQNEAATQNVARCFATICKAPLRIYFYGEIGSGKTTFIRALLQALGVNEKVKSPSFSLVEPYEIDDYRVYHVDLYRLVDPREIEYLGLLEQIDKDSICCIEWAEKGATYLPQPDLNFFFSFSDEGRLLNIEAKSQLGIKLLSALIKLIESEG